RCSLPPPHPPRANRPARHSPPSEFRQLARVPPQLCQIAPPATPLLPIRRLVRSARTVPRQRLRLPNVQPARSSAVSLLPEQASRPLRRPAAHKPGRPHAARSPRLSSRTIAVRCALSAPPLPPATSRLTSSPAPPTSPHPADRRRDRIARNATPGAAPQYPSASRQPTAACSTPPPVRCTNDPPCRYALLRRRQPPRPASGPAGRRRSAAGRSNAARSPIR